MMVACSITMQEGDTATINVATIAEQVLTALGGDPAKDTCSVSVSSTSAPPPPPPPEPVGVAPAARE
jgi:hypothetical protein